MQWTSDEREEFCKYFAELWPRVNTWSGRRTILYVEACEGLETPPWAAKEALRDIRVGWETESPPPARRVAQAANSNLRREASTRVPQQYADRDPNMKAENFAELDEWWAPRVNHPDKGLREKYRKALAVVRKGEVPTLREPGED